MDTSMNKRIYVAYTGGTIGMKHSSEGFVPVEGHLTNSINDLN
jgi:L-asparaginase